MRLDSVDSMLQSWEARVKREANLEPSWTFENGSVPGFPIGVAFEGEFTVSLNSWFALGAGIGFFYNDLTADETVLTVNRSVEVTDYSHPTTVSGIPLHFLGYFSFPFGRNFEVYGKGGAGFLRAKYMSREGTKRAQAKNYLYPNPQVAEATGPCYQAGGGVAYHFNQNLGFFLEAVIDLAQASGFEGENLSGENGVLYSIEEYLPDLDFWEKKIEIRPEAPSGPLFRSVEETTVDFSGFSIKIGIFMKF